MYVLEKGSVYGGVVCRLYYEVEFFFLKEGRDGLVNEMFVVVWIVRFELFLKFIFGGLYNKEISFFILVIINGRIVFSEVFRLS